MSRSNGITFSLVLLLHWLLFFVLELDVSCACCWWCFVVIVIFSWWIVYLPYNTKYNTKYYLSVWASFQQQEDEKISMLYMLAIFSSSCWYFSPPEACDWHARTSLPHSIRYNNIPKRVYIYIMYHPSNPSIHPSSRWDAVCPYVQKYVPTSPPSNLHLGMKSSEWKGDSILHGISFTSRAGAHCQKQEGF